jgi:uncharacterized membrane protein YbhN (UPF0104 family)
VAILVIAGVFLVRTVGEVNWGDVRDALADLAWWQAVVLVVLLLARQLLGALPLSFYVPGVTAFQATLNDQVGILLSSFAPPPSDVAARTAMFSSWGVPVPVGVAGTLLNMLTFFIVRFGAPAGGIVLSLATGAALGLGWLDLIFILGSIVLVVGLHLLIRSDELARTIGLRSGSLVRRVKGSVDPETWADAFVRFRHDVAANFQHGFGRSILATIGMLIVDCSMMLLALRFVGLSSSEVGATPIVIAYLFAFPLTLLPFFGLGVVDVIIIAAAVEAGGQGVEAAAIAGMVVWRVFNTGGPLILGSLALLGWRASVRRAAREPLR